jgi:saccharopine dehydrogenase-like NADP-dependent oxidoreductase
MSALQSVLVIGAGPVGNDATQVMARMPEPPTIVVADRNLDRAAATAASVADRTAARVEQLDASDPDAVARLAAGVDVVLHLAHSGCNETVMAGALAAGAHYVDVAMSPAEPEAFMTGTAHTHDAAFRSAGHAAVSGIGTSPGMTNLLAVMLAEPLIQIDSVDLWTAWSFGSDDDPATRLRRYRPLYSAALELQGYSEPVKAWVDGRFQVVEPFTGAREHEFPGNLGTMLMMPYHHEEPWSLPLRLGRGVQRVQYHYPIQPEAATLVLSGLTSTEPIEINGVSVAPIEVVTAAVGPSLAEQASLGTAGAAIAGTFQFWIEVEVVGADEHGAVRESAVWTLDTWAPDRESAGERRDRVGVATPVAGFCAVVAARLVASGDVAPGVASPEAVPAAKFFAGMAELGLPMRYRRTSSRIVSA